MRTRTLFLVLLKAVIVAFVVAQSNAAKTTPDAAAPGIVRGHVFLPAGNLPARFANVALQPVDRKPIERRGSVGQEIFQPRILPMELGADSGRNFFANVAYRHLKDFRNRPGKV